MAPNRENHPCSFDETPTFSATPTYQETSSGFLLTGGAGRTATVDLWWTCGGGRISLG